MKKNWRNKPEFWLPGWVLGLVLVTLSGCQSGTENKESQSPANPITSDRPAHNHAGEAAEYTCPMHPQIVQDAPGSCPICGMDLVKKHPAGVGDSMAVGAGLNALLKPTNSVVVANIGTVHPERRNEPVAVDANGIVTYDTRRLYTIPARFGGRIEKLYVRYNYQPVRKGQKLLELYSPDIVTAQRELIYLLESDATNAPLIAAAKQKLRLLGVTDGQISGLVNTHKPSYSLAVFSPYDGYVVEATAPPPDAPTQPGMGTPSGRGMGGGMSSGTDEITFSQPAPASENMGSPSPLLLREGQYVTTGQTLFRVVNAGKLWAEFRLYARDATDIKTGDPLTITFDQTRQAPLKARVSLVVPFLENGTRFTTIRVYLPGGANTRVGQLAHAKIQQPATRGLWLPAAAVLDLGNEQVAFLQTGAGIFQPVRVQTGPQAGNQIAITGGLTADQAVAENAQFLIDSESFVNVTTKK
ncbi:efflux RND transporter periplasmic adaptor subunit [Spirosoma luteum]|uniref:efflux RND transporter periplasmic adaptor subunit n=1 Tax=Spirosoma luteum TaxID=431553 RepID=UPI0003607343|nr:efflux RND transporter periplasmic adaptor subunit [Spirosoma luteum]